MVQMPAPAHRRKELAHVVLDDRTNQHVHLMCALIAIYGPFCERIAMFEADD
jgi:hypothetical protein